MLDGQKDLCREVRSSKTQVTDELKELRQFYAELNIELQQTLRKEIETEVERKVSEKVAPLQKDLAAMKVEMQQMRERMESSPPSSRLNQMCPILRTKLTG